MSVRRRKRKDLVHVEVPVARVTFTFSRPTARATCAFARTDTWSLSQSRRNGVNTGEREECAYHPTGCTCVCLSTSQTQSFVLSNWSLQDFHGRSSAIEFNAALAIPFPVHHAVPEASPILEPTQRVRSEWVALDMA